LQLFNISILTYYNVCKIVITTCKLTKNKVNQTMKYIRVASVCCTLYYADAVNTNGILYTRLI